MGTELLVVGLSHRTAPVRIRERLAVATESLAHELHDLRRDGVLREGLLLSTCNRVELYAASQDAASASAAIRQYLKDRATPDTIDHYLYERFGSDCVLHAFRVAASLDSMVVGEPQILGQLKQAFTTAEATQAIGTLLGRCFHRAFAVAKRVRTETGIAAGAVSVSSIAVELARKIFGQLDDRRVLLIGAGKMGEAAAKTLANQGARLFVLNRSPEKAQELAAACDGEARPYEQLAVELAAADVAISSTSSTRFVITPELMHDVIKARRRRPLFLIDIAVPRDIDPRAGEMENVFLYDVDDLQQIAGENLAVRRREAEAAERLVTTEVAMFEQWRKSLEITPTIVALRKQFRGIAQSELERTLPRLKNLQADDERALNAMCDAIVNKLLHRPLTNLKQSAEGDDESPLIDSARQLFALDEESASEPRQRRRSERPSRAAPPITATPSMATVSSIPSSPDVRGPRGGGKESA